MVTLPVFNPLDRRLDPLLDKPDGSLVIHEIYRSIQGESTFAGLPCVFVRLTACHLRCVYCDTAHAFQTGKRHPIADVVEMTLAYKEKLVEITGGEPLLQPEVYPLMTNLADAGCTVLLETSGALDTSRVDPRVRIILDLKTPGSGEVGANFEPNFDRLRPTDEVKIVICNHDDFLWAKEQICNRNLFEKCPVLVSPVYGHVEPQALATWVLDSRLPIRVQIQLHKALWGAKTRGV